MSRPIDLKEQATRSTGAYEIAVGPPASKKPKRMVKGTMSCDLTAAAAETTCPVKRKYPTCHPPRGGPPPSTKAWACIPSPSYGRPFSDGLPRVNTRVFFCFFSRPFPAGCPGLIPGFFFFFLFPTFSGVSEGHGYPLVFNKYDDQVASI